jgi:hypothetical protein
MYLTPDQALKHFLDKYYWDPLGFVQDPEALNHFLWTKQREIITSVFKNPRTAVKAGHSVGKTFVAAMAALAFLYLRQPSKVITTAPTGRQVRSLLWSEINAIFNRSVKPIFGGECLQTGLSLGPDWYALGFSTDDPDNVSGFHQEHILVIVDEAMGIDQPIFDALESLCASGDAHMLLIGNPSGASGPFFNACESTDWNTITVSCLDSPNFTGEKVPTRVQNRLVTRDWVESRKSAWGEDSAVYSARVLGEFPLEGPDTLIPLAWIDGAMRKELDPGVILPRHLGVDVAWEGDDSSVLMARTGAQIHCVGRVHQRDPLEVAELAASIMEERSTDICVVDKVGIGAGTLAALMKKNVEGFFTNDTRIFGFNGAEKSRRVDDHGIPLFPNRRSESWWHMREALNPDTGWLALEPNDQMRADLSAPRYGYTGRNQIVVESKDKFKKRLGRSPDYGDAAVYALDCEQWRNYKALLTETRGAVKANEYESGGTRIPTLASARDMPC